MFVTSKLAISLLILTFIVIVVIRFAYAYDSIDDIPKTPCVVVGVLVLMSSLSVFIAIIDLIWFY